MVGQPGFFDVGDRLKRLSDFGDQLEGFSAAVNFEIFRPTLDAEAAGSANAGQDRPCERSQVAGPRRTRSRRNVDQNGSASLGAYVQPDDLTLA
jgi:hypothetical protein